MKIGTDPSGNPLVVEIRHFTQHPLLPQGDNEGDSVLGSHTLFSNSKGKPIISNRTGKKHDPLVRNFSVVRILTYPNGKESDPSIISDGIAIAKVNKTCKDAFNKRFGRVLALRRALSKIPSQSLRDNIETMIQSDNPHLLKF
jgi:hypothetical protein